MSTLSSEQQRTPHEHAAWRLASELGASVVSSTSSAVTHVIAGSDGTDKVRWARSHKVPAVSLDWLASCGYLWRRVEERSFRIDGKRASDKGQPASKLPDQLCQLPPPELK